MFTHNGKQIKRVGFLGLGKSNIGVFDYISRHFNHLEITVRNFAPLDTSPFGAKRAYFGKDMLTDINEDILFVSPSARRDKQEICRAKENGVILSSDAELFFSKVSSDVYAVTGSDGKSTTTYLASKLLSDSYSAAIPCGNIGDALSPHLDDPVGYAYVTELSSFQLNYFKPVCECCVITNITKNHLNWHTSFEEYIEAKRNVLELSKKRILNFDCEITRDFARDYDVYAVFSQKMSEGELKRLVKAELYITEENGFIRACGENLLDTAKILIAGEHNVLNFMSAIAMSLGKFTRNNLTALAESFSGLSHRCELVGTLNGVKYYNSSIDSSPKRCIATLTMMQKKVILILGGRSKGLDFAELLPTVEEKVKYAIITGECAGELDNVLSKSKVPYERTDDFFEAVGRAVEIAESGDTVLLSPAATSYDRFANFEERGEAFKRFLKMKGI